MIRRGDPGLEFDFAAFDPYKIQAVTHRLVDHPLLELPSLIRLCERLEARNSVRSHNAGATPSTSFHHAPETHPPRLTPSETVKRIEEAQAWLSLLNVQQDPEYRELVDEVLDHVRPRIDTKDPGLCHRGGWIFITSPNAVTPYHFDHEHNFILQVLGRKTLHVWDPLDREVVSEEALEFFHAKSSREKLTYSDAIEKKAHVFELEPGLGGYLPSTAPHWVKNGPGVSITASFTYYTDLTRRREVAHTANYFLRRAGITPTPVGASPVFDSLKQTAFRVYRGAKRMLPVGTRVPPPSRYAQP